MKFALAFCVGIDMYHLKDKLSQIVCPILYIVHVCLFFFFGSYHSFPNHSLHFYMHLPVGNFSAPFHVLTGEADC